MMKYMKETDVNLSETDRDLFDVTQINIRKAVMDDLDTIARLEAACFPEAEAATKESLAGRLQIFPDRFWILEKKGKIISVIDGILTNEASLRDEMYENAKMHNPKGDWQMIFGVETAPEFQHRGYAAKLMERVISDCREEGRIGIVLTCKEALISFYEKFGYVNEGVSESVHGGVVWYRMRLTLNKKNGRKTR